MVDPNSLTWKSVQRFIEEQRQDSIDFLVADRDSERQRGALALLEKLEGLANQEGQQQP